MKLIVFTVVIVSSIIHHVLSECSIDVRTELNRTATGTVREPLFLKYSGSEYKLAIPEANGQLLFKRGESALIACTSDQKPNNLTFNNKQSSTINCIDENSFNVDSKTYKVNEFNECSLQITGSVINRNIKCGGNGTLISIGYQLDESRGFVTLIDVCYNKKAGSTIYAKHFFHGKAIKNAMKSNTRPSTFKTSEVPSNINAPKLFTKSSQLKRFEEIFGNHEKAQELLNKTYLARGHLAPDADFIFVSWQFSTYYYINTVPQWQSINNANWKHVESVVRSVADTLKKDVEIFTGGFDVLRLNNKKISLSPNGLQVPKWSWKVVKVPDNNSGIAFLTYNNPFTTSSPNTLCPDVCNDHGWDWKDRKTFAKGFTICCRISDLMNAIPTVPTEARANTILEK